MPGALSYYINESSKSGTIADIEEVRRKYRELEFQRKMEERTSMYNMIGKLVSITGSVARGVQDKIELLDYATKKGINTTSGKFYNILFDPKFERNGQELSTEDIRTLMFFDEYSANRQTLFDVLNNQLPAISNYGDYLDWRQSK